MTDDEKRSSLLGYGIRKGLLTQWIEFVTEEIFTKDFAITMEQHALKNVNNCLNTNIYSYLETFSIQKVLIYI